MQAAIVTHTSVLAQLSETMRMVASSKVTAIEDVVERLQAQYRGHLYVEGVFSSKVTIWGFPELTFTGMVMGESVTHTIWCY